MWVDFKEKSRMSTNAINIYTLLILEVYDEYQSRGD